MNKLTRLLFLSGIVVAGALSACNKDTGGNGTTENLNALFDQLKTDPQTFTVAAGQQQVITGAAGTKITFAPGSFKHQNGTDVAAGSITIHLTEVYRPGQMIANRTNTVTEDGRLLTSGGQVLLKAYQGSEELTAGRYEIAFRQDAQNNSPMALFYAEPPASGTVIWGNDTSNTIPRSMKDSGSNFFYYTFDSCTRFDWINCDYFYTAPAPKSDIFISTPDSSFNPTNTQVFVVFPDLNMVGSMFTYDAATHTFSFGATSYFLPLGTSVKVVLLSVKNEQTYMEVMEDIDVTQDLLLNYDPEPVTVSAMQAALNDL